MVPALETSQVAQSLSAEADREQVSGGDGPLPAHPGSWVELANQGGQLLGDAGDQEALAWYRQLLDGAADHGTVGKGRPRRFAWSTRSPVGRASVRGHVVRIAC